MWGLGLDSTTARNSTIATNERTFELLIAWCSFDLFHEYVYFDFDTVGPLSERKSGCLAS